MRSKRLILVAITMLVVLLFVSCANGENRFIGGELLDEEKLSEIRSSVFFEEKVEISTEGSVNSTEREGKTETESEIESETELESDSQTEGEERTVYWTEKGSVWHSAEDCRYIKNSTVICGALNDAVEAGMERPCSACGK